MVTLAIVGRAYVFTGTDFDGRDLAQALLFGFPIALAIGFVTSAVVSLIGMVLGVFSGYYGGSQIRLFRGQPIFPVTYRLSLDGH
jgi:peptide/nickel transport system permease protein